MAKLNVEVKPNGDMKYTLEFADKTFDITMVRTDWGAQGDKPSLDSQVEKELGDILNNILGEFDTEEILEAIDDMNYSTGDWAGDIVILTEFEERLKAEAMP